MLTRAPHFPPHLSCYFLREATVTPARWYLFFFCSPLLEVIFLQDGIYVWLISVSHPTYTLHRIVAQQMFVKWMNKLVHWWLDGWLSGWIEATSFLFLCPFFLSLSTILCTILHKRPCSTIITGLHDCHPKSWMWCPSLPHPLIKALLTRCPSWKLSK